MTHVFLMKRLNHVEPKVEGTIYIIAIANVKQTGVYIIYIYGSHRYKLA